jgi:serine/threonine protein phosphatase PrpC
MKHQPNENYEQDDFPIADLRYWPLFGAIGLFWQEPGSSPWLWFALASSPLVIIIIMLVVAILLLLFVVWLRARRQQTEATQSPPIILDTSSTEASPTAVVDEATTVPTAPVGYSEDMAKTQPSQMVRPEPTQVPTQVSVTVEAEPQILPVSGQRPANITWQIAGLTDVGLKRELNEDTLLMAENVMADGTPFGLYAVADGLGGHQGGEVASQLAIEAVQSYLSQSPPIKDMLPFEDWLRTGAQTANEVVLACHEDITQTKKMGSTLVMALVTAGQAHIANVGDSRAYHLNSDRIEQISEDHSLVERLVQIGQLTREEARKHKNRNVLYNSLGDKEKIEIGLYHVDLQPGDRLLLCSDGLSGMITDDEILQISRIQPDPAGACKEMVKAAKIAGGSDNITAIIVQVNAQLEEDTIAAN